MSTTPAIPDTFAAAPKPDDYTAVINLLTVLGEARNQLTELETEVARSYGALVLSVRDKYAKIQTTISEHEAALEVITRRNPQWFAQRKNVTTPFGSVKFKSSTELVCADEEAAIAQILRARRPRLLRRSIELNRDILATLPDDELAEFGITRKPKENITIDTQMVELGKAVTAADKTTKGAAKTARAAAALTGSANA